jgi:hypothetical protein
MIYYDNISIKCLSEILFDLTSLKRIEILGFFDNYWEALVWSNRLWYLGVIYHDRSVWNLVIYRCDISVWYIKIYRYDISWFIPLTYHDIPAWFIMIYHTDISVWYIFMITHDILLWAIAIYHEMSLMSSIHEMSSIIKKNKY